MRVERISSRPRDQRFLRRKDKVVGN